jgi:hypothetical protein
VTAAERAARARQQKAARWARRTPGFRLAVDTVLPAVRRNATLTDVVWRVFMPQHGAGTLPVPFHGGVHLTGRDTALLPVVGVLALGLTDGQLETLVDQVAGLQRADRSFRPLLVLDRPAFGAARRHGYVVELVVPRAAWDSYPQAVTGTGATAWEDYLGRRLAGIVDHYQLWHLARAGADGLDPLDLTVLRAITARLPETLDVRREDGEDGEDGG